MNQSLTAEHSWIVATDIDAIQSYLLQSVHLNTIAGASNVVVGCDEEIKRRVGAASIVIASGGIGLVTFPSSDVANCFANDIVRWYRDDSVSGNLTVGDPVLVDDTQPFGESAYKAFQNLERKKRAGFQRSEKPTIPQGQICGSCGAELVAKRVRIGRDADAQWRPLGHACLQKYNRLNRHFWLQWLCKAGDEKADAWKSLDPRQSIAHDFNKLAGDHDLGLIVADADGTGRLLKKLRAADRQAWVEFSKGLDELAKSVLVRAINAVVPVKFLNELAEEYLPIQPLFCGGDDFVIACRGDLALPLASTLCREFARADKSAWCPGGKLGLSAAVVVTRPGFPFRVAHRIASEFLHAAKREAKQRGWSADRVGAIDYALITESMADGESILAERIVTSTDGKLSLQLTARPYKACDSGPRSIGGLADATQILKLKEFPRSKLHELRELTAKATWLPMVASVTRNELQEIRSAIEASFSDWLGRSRRQLHLDSVLDDVQHHLALDKLESGEQLWIAPASDAWGAENDCDHFYTPLGDLADAGRLLGSLSQTSPAKKESVRT